MCCRSPLCLHVKFAIISIVQIRKPIQSKDPITPECCNKTNSQPPRRTHYRGENPTREPIQNKVSAVHWEKSNTPRVQNSGLNARCHLLMNLKIQWDKSQLDSMIRRKPKVVSRVEIFYHSGWTWNAQACMYIHLNAANASYCRSPIRSAMAKRCHFCLMNYITPLWWNTRGGCSHAARGKKTEKQVLKARAYTPTQLIYKSCI